ncbi:MAG: TolC family protein [Tannerellaceae bacterium]|nr:TolC family protein [Tannerellaceae bacterium]
MKRFNILWALLVLAMNAFSQQTLTLEECRDMAILNNRELQITATKIKGAEYQKKEAFTNYFPQISATGAYVWLDTQLELLNFDKLGSIGSVSISSIVPQSVKDFLTLDINDIWLGSVRLTQPVFAGGKIVTYNQIAKYAEELAISMDNLTLQNVIYLTDQTYWQVVSVANKKELADAYVELLEKMNRDVQAMIEEGVATQADGLSVRVKLNEAKMAQTKAENGLALSRMLLAKIIGVPLDSDIHLVDEQVESVPVSLRPATASVEEAWENRQEIRSLELATKIYKKRERLALADMLPTVGVTGGYTSYKIGGFMDDFSSGFNAGVIVSVPISGWWGGTYKRNAARAETHIKKLELLDAKELIELEVNESVYKVNEANKRLIAARSNMESAEENLEHAQYGFEEGVITPLLLMEAQTAWVAARSELIDSQIDVKLTDVYLTKALGKLAPDEIQ